MLLCFHIKKFASKLNFKRPYPIERPQVLFANQIKYNRVCDEGTVELHKESEMLELSDYHIEYKTVAMEC